MIEGRWQRTFCMFKFATSIFLIIGGVFWAVFMFWDGVLIERWVMPNCSWLNRFAEIPQAAPTPCAINRSDLVLATNSRWIDTWSIMVFPMKKDVVSRFKPIAIELDAKFSSKDITDVGMPNAGNPSPEFNKDEPMVYRIYPDFPDMTQYAPEFLDGDISKVVAVDLTRDEVKVLPAFSRFSGRPVDTTYLPTKVNIGGPERWLMDISPNGLYSVSEKFRNIVERLEPSVHQFVPVEFFWGDGSPAAKRYWFFVCNRLDSVSREETTKELRNLWKASAKNGEFVFSRAQIGGHHIWQDKFMPAGYGPFISDVLYDALVDAGIEGLGIEAFRETN